MKAKISFRLSPDGKIHFDNVKNVGSSCTKFLEQFAVDQDLKLEELGPTTPDFYVEPEKEVDQNIEI
jgi:hypothetical protein